MIKPFISYIRPAVRDQRGQTFAEYALLLGVLSLGLLLAFQPLGVSVQGLLNAITNAF